MFIKTFFKRNPTIIAFYYPQDYYKLTHIEELYSPGKPYVNHMLEVIPYCPPLEENSNCTFDLNCKLLSINPSDKKVTAKEAASLHVNRREAAIPNSRKMEEIHLNFDPKLEKKRLQAYN